MVLNWLLKNNWLLFQPHTKLLPNTTSRRNLVWGHFLSTRRHGKNWIKTRTHGDSCVETVVKRKLSSQLETGNARIKRLDAKHKLSALLLQPIITEQILTESTMEVTLAKWCSPTYHSNICLVQNLLLKWNELLFIQGLFSPVHKRHIQKLTKN